MSFQHGLSGLNAAARNLDVIGNNVANANTVGAKSSRAEFSDLYANSLTGVNSSSVGIGVAVSSVAQQFTQGDIVSSQNPLDMAINGRGFFRLTARGAVEYSRNGQFKLDKDEYIVNANGARLSGYQVDQNGFVRSGTPGDLQINLSDIAPQPTSVVRGQLNLDARSTALTSTFDSADPNTYHGAMSVVAFDTLGRDQQVTTYFRKVPSAIAGESSWEVRLSANGVDVPGVAGTLRFSTSGAVIAPSGRMTVSVPVSPEAVNPMTFDLDFSNATQFGSNFSTNEVTQDGYSSGRLAGFNVDSTGMLVGRYSNGQTRAQGQIVLVNFMNPQGLSPNGNNSWVETGSSGQPTLGAPGTGVMGALQGSSVESSNVDLTGELVNMITAQRVYQANAQTIKTHDQTLQTIVNLR